MYSRTIEYQSYLRLIILWCYVSNRLFVLSHQKIILYTAKTTYLPIIITTQKLNIFIYVKINQTFTLHNNTYIIIITSWYIMRQSYTWYGYEVSLWRVVLMIGCGPLVIWHRWLLFHLTVLYHFDRFKRTLRTVCGRYGVVRFVQNLVL